MNRVLIIIALALIVAFSACQQNDGKMQSATVETENDTIALSLGYSIGGNVKDQFSELDVYLVAKGLVEAVEGKQNPLFAEERDAEAAIRNYVRKQSDLKAQKNLEEGKKFLEENAKKDDVQVTESGLQYTVISEGNGPKPTAENTVKVHYHGTTIDGVVFDSSIERGKPAQFPLKGVIAGWTEGLQLMSVGSKYKFFIPSELAYGPRGAGASVEPNSALVFEVELVEIVK